MTLLTPSTIPPESPGRPHGPGRRGFCVFALALFLGALLAVGAHTHLDTWDDVGQCAVCQVAGQLTAELGPSSELPWQPRLVSVPVTAPPVSSAGGEMFDLSLPRAPPA